MKALHTICHQTNGRFNNVRNVNPAAGEYLSGWWQLPAEEAPALVGGWLYLHETSGAKSGLAGRILGVNFDDQRKAYDIHFRIVRAVAPVAWRGAKAGQSPQHYFRIVDASLPHETA